MFGGARGEQFETKCDQIEHMFTNALDNVKSVSASILDVQAPSWYDDVLQFRSIIKDIEVRLQLQKAAKTEEQSSKTLLAQQEHRSKSVMELNFLRFLQTIIENLVESVFEGVNHVEEAVIALYSLSSYSKRKNLRRIFKKKTAEVCYDQKLSFEDL